MNRAASSAHVRAPAAHGGDVSGARRRLGLAAGPLADLSSSLNPLGPPPSVLRVLERAAQYAAVYPEPRSESLRAELARRHGVSPDHVVVGNGSNELVFLLPRAVPARRAWVLEPTYTEYARASAGAALSVRRRLAQGPRFTPHPFRTRPRDVVWLANPNNPTAAAWDRAELLGWIDRNASTTFVVDEAFLPFCSDGNSESLVTEAAVRPNLIVLRSLTKLFAVPGLRLGYLVTSARLARRVLRRQPTWSVACVAQAAGIAALSDTDYLQRTHQLLPPARERLRSGLAQLGDFAVLPSGVNFVLVRSDRPHWPAVALELGLARRGFLIRDASNFHGLDERYFRIAVPLAETVDRFTRALRELLEQQP